MSTNQVRVGWSWQPSSCKTHVRQEPGVSKIQKLKKDLRSNSSSSRSRRQWLQQPHNRCDPNFYPEVAGGRFRAPLWACRRRVAPELLYSRGSVLQAPKQLNLVLRAIISEKMFRCVFGFFHLLRPHDEVCMFWQRANRNRTGYSRLHSD